MKNIYLFVTLCLLNIATHAQLVPCRPRICMFDYNYHNDASPNADMTTIQTVKPDMLVDNTAHGYWGESNGYTGCIPSMYTSLGIQVYSYIAGGYEGTKYGNNIDNLNKNLARVAGIKTDNATGVFLDEVSSYPSTSSKAYIKAISDSCKSLGLKLIINPGVKNFDPWLMTVCDYILTDEQYDGLRAPTASEALFLDRVIVITEGKTNAATAVNVSVGARKNCFGYSYACNQYTQIPSWISTYMTDIVQKPATPVITGLFATLSSNASCGTQWYSVAGGKLTGQTNSTYTATVNGTYYAITTIDGCASDTSNKITLTTTTVPNTNVETGVEIYPNPAAGHVLISIHDAVGADHTRLVVYDVNGRVVYKDTIVVKEYIINTTSFANGTYEIVLEYSNGDVVKRPLVVQH